MVMRIPSKTSWDLAREPFSSEDGLQRFIEDRLFVAYCGLRVVSSSLPGGRRLGRIDMAAIDDEGTPTIVEYKRDMVDRKAKNQLLRYRQWLLSHRELFQKAVSARWRGQTVSWKQPHLVAVGFRFDPGVDWSPDASEILLLRYSYSYDRDHQTIFIQQVDHKDARTFGDQAAPRVVHKGGTLWRQLAKTTVAAQEAFDSLRVRLKVLGFDEIYTGKNLVRYRKGELLAAELTFTAGGLQLFFGAGHEIDDPEGRVRPSTKSRLKWTMLIVSRADVDYFVRLLGR